MPRDAKEYLVQMAVMGREVGSLLIGRTIVDVRIMTKEEADREGWDHRPFVLVMDDGTSLFASRDDEGNGAGALFFWRDDDSWMLPVVRG